MKRFECLLASSLCLAPAAAGADEFMTTNLQALYGVDFEDPAYGNDTADGRMFTLTIEHYSTWAYGDNYVLLDTYHGDFVDANGAKTKQRVKMYLEWTPRLSFARILDVDGFGPFADLYLAGQLGRQEGTPEGSFQNNMIGAGFKLRLPKSYLVGLNGFLRKDNFNDPTYHFTPYWVVWFSIGAAKFEGNGYFDIAGRDYGAPDINSQPQLLFDAGSLWARLDNKLHLGIEWYFHYRGAQLTPTYSTPRLIDHAPQAMARWTW